MNYICYTYINTLKTKLKNMTILAICKNCDTNFKLKNDYAWKIVECSNCLWEIEVTDIEKEEEKSSNVINKEWVFSHDIYWIKQKRIAINEKYFIRDKDNNELLFSLRKAYVMRWLLSVFTAIIIIALSIYAWFTIWGFDNLVVLATFIILWLILAIFTAVYIFPKKHITFFKSDKETKWDPEFEIKEDSKFQFFNKTFTMLDNEKQIICKFRKNVFTDILRKKWHMEFEWNHIEIKEDSILLWLLRRFGPFWNLIRTNFIFTNVWSNEALGMFKRKFELFDNYTLDLSNDTENKIPRQLSLWMAILLDTWEKR